MLLQRDIIDRYILVVDYMSFKMKFSIFELWELLVVNAIKEENARYFRHTYDSHLWN